MKTIRIILTLALAISAANAAPPAVGSVSINQQFARRSGSAFVSADLEDYEGKILVLMLMTPWCSICKGHAEAVGNGILDHFDDASRGALRGKNDNGVPIQSLLLSTEEIVEWDSTNASFASINGYDQWGLDANAQRQNPRKLLGYYRDGIINSGGPINLGNDRRRLIVLNLIKGSKSHSFREIIINQNTYSSDNDTSAQKAINDIMPEMEPTLPAFELKQGSNTLESGTTLSFGKLAPGGSATITLTIRNSGVGDLTGISTALSGTQPADYQVNGPSNTTVAPNQSTSFTVTFKPLADGTRKAVLNLTSTASGVQPFAVDLSGFSGQPAPEIEVRQPKESKLRDGKSKRSFGTAMIRSKGRSLTFRIINTGDAPLTGIAIEKSGDNPGDFIISEPGKTQLAPDKSAMFKVTFMPKGDGPRKATLKIRSNDANEDPFNITVTGLGIKDTGN